MAMNDLYAIFPAKYGFIKFSLDGLQSLIDGLPSDIDAVVEITEGRTKPSFLSKDSRRWVDTGGGGFEFLP